MINAVPGVLRSMYSTEHVLAGPGLRGLASVVDIPILSSSNIRDPRDEQVETNTLAWRSAAHDRARTKSHLKHHVIYVKIGAELHGRQAVSDGVTTLHMSLPRQGAEHAAGVGAGTTTCEATNRAERNVARSLQVV